MPASAMQGGHNQYNMQHIHGTCVKLTLDD